MPKSTITITPIENIQDNQVLDNDLVTTTTADSNLDIFLIENICTGERRKGNLMGISLYDDVLVEPEATYKILSMLTKES